MLATLGARVPRFVLLGGDDGGGVGGGAGVGVSVGILLPAPSVRREEGLIGIGGRLAVVDLERAVGVVVRLSGG